MTKKMFSKNFKLNKAGFTLVETLVVLSIFSILITMVVSIFINSAKSQRKIIELHQVQREGGYLLETISRELRMAIKIDDTQKNKESSEIEFTNYNNDLIKYCRSNGIGVCDSVGDFMARDGKVISPSNVKITDLTFYTSESFSAIQPLITISMRMESVGNYNTEIILQNSMALRIY